MRLAAAKYACPEGIHRTFFSGLAMQALYNAPQSTVKSYHAYDIDLKKYRAFHVDTKIGWLEIQRYLKMINC